MDENEWLRKENDELRAERQGWQDLFIKNSKDILAENELLRTTLEKSHTHTEVKPGCVVCEALGTRYGNNKTSLEATDNAAGSQA